MEITKFFQSKTFQIITWVIAILIFTLLIFKAGMIVGEKKAGFSFGWGENYHRNFGGPPQGFMGDFNDRNFIEADGVFGQIIKVDNSNLVIKGKNDVERAVLVSDQTTIKSMRDNIKAADLKVDDYVVIIGEPNDAGQIAAKFIRVMPSPPPAPNNPQPTF